MVRLRPCTDKCNRKEGLTWPQHKRKAPENGAPHLVNLSVMGVPSEIMLHFLETKGIYVSSGSACAKGAKSSVLAAYGLPDERIKSALRVSFSKDNTPEDIDALLEALSEGISKYRRIASL